MSVTNSITSSRNLATAQGHLAAWRPVVYSASLGMPYLLALPRRWNKAHTTKKLMWAFGICFSVLLGWSGTVRAAVTNPQLWLAPPDNITQPSSLGFDGFLEHPNEWAAAARLYLAYSPFQQIISLKAPRQSLASCWSGFPQRGLSSMSEFLLSRWTNEFAGTGIEGMVWPARSASSTKAQGPRR